jgi:putative ABC transport system permease protein
VAALTLALGIGATSAVFSIFNAVMLRPLPYKDSSRLVMVNVKAGMFPDMNLFLSWPTFQAIREEARSFEQSAVYWTQSKALTGRGDPQLLEVAGVSEDFFSELGAKAELGRLFGESDSASANVVVLSESLWRSRFAADPNVVGQVITLDGKPYSIAGVAQRGFAFPDEAEAWAPLIMAADIKTNPTFFRLGFVGKLRPHANLRELQLQLDVVAAQVQRQFPEMKGGYSLLPTELLEVEVGESRAAFFALLAAAMLVLLIACTNLASMLLSRGWGRQQEMAVRAALGASCGRIFRQLLVESCLLALLGGSAGVLLAAGGVRLFGIVAPEDTPRLAEIHPDWTMIAFAGGCAVITGLLFGFAPARDAVRAALQSALKESGAKGESVSVRQSRMGGLLIAGEIALAFVLLTSAGLMLQTLQRLMNQSPGFRAENLLSFDLHRAGSDSALGAIKDAAATVEQTRDVVAQIQSTPGVESVAAVNYGLLSGLVTVHGGMRVEGANASDAGAGFSVTARDVSPTYFQTLGLALLRGREFTERDSLGSSPVIIVNAHMAKQFWGTLDVLGKRISILKDERGKEIWSEVVGVAADAREIQVRDQPKSEYYVPLYQGGAGTTSLLVRTAEKPEALADTITRRIWNRYPNLPVTHVSTMEAIIEKSVGNERLHTALLGVFAATGLLMALAGIYGVIAYTVERRTREIGIRVAMGANREDILMMVGRHALLPVLMGIAVGMPVAMIAQRAIASELYGVRASDPVTYVAAGLLILLVAVAACLVPARRATQVDPMVALRYE